MQKRTTRATRGIRIPVLHTVSRGGIHHRDSKMHCTCNNCPQRAQEPPKRGRPVGTRRCPKSGRSRNRPDLPRKVHDAVPPARHLKWAINGIIHNWGKYIPVLRIGHMTDISHPITIFPKFSAFAKPQNGPIRGIRGDPGPGIHPLDLLQCITVAHDPH